MTDNNSNGKYGKKVGKKGVYISFTSPLYGIPDNIIDSLFYQSSPRTYQKNEYIFIEGSKPAGVFFIETGKVKLIKEHDGKRKKIVRLHKDGDIMGYRSMISDEPYSATAQAFEPTVIYLIPYGTFEHAMRNCYQLCHNVMKLLAMDLKRAEENLYYAVNKGAVAKVASALLLLQEVYGDPITGKIDIPLRREDIAELAGLSVETTIRSLSFLRKNGIVGFDNKIITLLNKEALKNIVQTDKKLV